MPYLHFISRVLDRLGTFGFKYKELSQLLHLHTTDLSFKVSYEGTLEDPNSTDGFAVISISCLNRYVEQMFDAVISLMTEPDFKDLSHISKLLRMESSDSAYRVGADPQASAVAWAESL